jgi:site-specific DNA recombinase
VKRPISDAITVSAPQALLYLRVSTSKQATRGGEAEGYSIPAQRDACLRRASELGAVVPVSGEFIDAGASARSADRPALQALLARLGDRSLPHVAYVIVHKIDRLARDRADDVAIGLAIHQAGAVLVSATEAVDDTPAGTLLHGIMASIAEFYSKNLAAEVKKGQVSKARSGGTPGYVPLGYVNALSRIDGQEIRGVEVDSEREEHVRWLFETYSEGEYSITDLVQMASTRGLVNRATPNRPGRALTRSQIHRMLSSRYYLGKVSWAGVEYDGRHQPLIDPVLFARVQAVLGGRRLAGDRSWRNDHYLTGSLTCGHCGSRLGYGISTGKAGGKYPYFYCLGRNKKRTTCTLPYLSVETIERKVAAHWKTVRIPGPIAESVREDLLAQLNEQSAGSEKTVAVQRTRLQKLERTRQKLIDAYLGEAITAGDLKQRQEALAAEQLDAQRLIDSLSTDKAVLEQRVHDSLRLLTHCAELYLRSAPTARRTMNQAFFETIEVTEHGVTSAPLNAPLRVMRAVAEERSASDSSRPTDADDHEMSGGHNGQGTKRRGDEHPARKDWAGNANTAHRKAGKRCSDLTDLAEGMGFEPTVTCATHAFQACRIGRSRTPPRPCHPPKRATRT